MSQEITIDQLNAINKNTVMETLGIEFTGFSEEFISAKMPVNARVHQPMGILHGGVSLVMAETLGSVGSHFKIDTTSKISVGVEINANHVRSVSHGFIYGTAKPINIGKKLHIWEIKIVDDEDKLVCVSRLTVAVIDKK